MKILTKALQLRFVPSSIDLALLVLRLWIGLSMLALHGWAKFVGFAEQSTGFMDPFGLGPKATFALAVLAEAVGSVLIVLGLFTRVSALMGGAAMAVAFFIAHNGKLSGAGNGELAFIYLAAYVTLFLAGGGRYAVDMRIAAAAAPKSV
jgi:putative oxidoreductase